MSSAITEPNNVFIFRLNRMIICCINNIFRNGISLFIRETNMQIYSSNCRACLIRIIRTLVNTSREAATLDAWHALFLCYIISTAPSDSRTTAHRRSRSIARFFLLLGDISHNSFIKNMREILFCDVPKIGIFKSKVTNLQSKITIFFSLECTPLQWAQYRLTGSKIFFFNKNRSIIVKL